MLDLPKFLKFILIPLPTPNSARNFLDPAKKSEYEQRLQAQAIDKEKAGKVRNKRDMKMINQRFEGYE